jgi:hypothetical protein
MHVTRPLTFGELDDSHAAQASSVALSSLFLASAASLSAQGPAPIAKEQLMTPPTGARHFTISSMAGKHGDIWSWTLPNGHRSYRMSMNLRGWITEEDEQVTFGPDGRAIAIAVRGYNDSGDATENFIVDAGGVAHWKPSSTQDLPRLPINATTAMAAHGSPQKLTSRR